MMFRTKLTLAGLAAVAAIGAQTAVAQARSHGPSNPQFITDTLAPGGRAAPVQGYRFITDTLAPGGGPAAVQVAPAPVRFSWPDAGVGAGAAAGLLFVVVGTGLLVVRRRTSLAV
jgi:hypothetical protein